MTSIKPFEATDLFELNPINLDPLTENFYLQFYLQYLTKWPSLVFKSTSTDSISGYMLAKTEGSNKEWHAHISAVTVNPNYRRLGLASELCDHLERATEGEPYNTYFIDLFVKVTNSLAITMYKKLGYSIYRRVVGYYGSGNEISSNNRNMINDEIDAFDMRKSLKRDTANETIRENGEKVYALPHEIVF
ncbi:unnamed protein product [[Candida] boidinii]|nr:unnamed protein product [[Candida] boidinii]